MRAWIILRYVSVDSFEVFRRAWTINQLMRHDGVLSQSSRVTF
jgi:hypothetical protein